MPSYTEGRRGLEFLDFEVDPQFCREEVTLTASQGALLAGTVMAIVTGTGNWVPYDDDANAGVPGAGIAAGILLYDVPNSASTQKVTVLRRGPAVVTSDLLVWEASNDQTEKNAALAELLALNIVAR